MGGRGQRLCGYENDCNRHFSTVACCFNGPWAGRRGRVGASFQHSSQKGRHLSSMCNRIGIQQDAHRWFLNEGQDLGASWFTTTICGADIPFLPTRSILAHFSCLLPDGAQCRCCLSTPHSCSFVRKALQSPAPEMGEGDCLFTCFTRSGPSTASESRARASAALRVPLSSMVSGLNVNVL